MSTPNTQGVALTFRPELGALQAHLAALVAADSGDRFRDLRREIGEYAIGEIQDNFDNQRLADGSAMPQSAAAIARQGKTLIDRHRLYDSYVYQLPKDGVEWGSGLDYARIHHFGGETGRAGHRFEMEARPVMGWNDEMERHISGLILDELRGLAPGGTA